MSEANQVERGVGRPDHYEQCGLMHPPEFSNVRDPHGCLMPIGHVGPHEFVSSDGEAYQWEDDVCTDCDCDLEGGECCTVYWRK